MSESKDVQTVRIRMVIRLAIVDLQAKHKCNLSQLAVKLDIERAYLWKLHEGVKTNPSDKILRKLGLERVTIVQKITA